MTIILISVTLALLSLSALLAALETAITASSPGKMLNLKSEGSKRAVLVLGILKTKEKVISTMLIGNSLINTVCATLVANLFMEALGDHLGTLVSSVVMAIVIIVFVEAVPKAVAVAKAEKIILASAPLILFFLKVFRPVNFAIGIAIRVVCFIFRIDLKQEISGVDEVRGIIEHHRMEGNVYKSDGDMLEGILDLRDMDISEIMVHRSEMFSIDINLPKEKIIAGVLSGKNTRIPFWEGSSDNIIGILHVRDLSEALYKYKNDLGKINIKGLLSEPWFVPDDVAVVKQLNAFRERKNHLACVIDEYGALRGVITLEDILEEIVGHINDEYDEAHSFIVKKSEKEYIVEGRATIRDVNRELDWDLPDEDANTLAGLVINSMERIPEQGEECEISNLKIKVTKKLGNKIKTLRISVNSRE